MSTKSPRTFTREFKPDLCRQIQSGLKRPAQLCREHQLTEGLLLGWRREFDQRGDVALSAKDAPEVSSEASSTALLEQKVAELECFCGQLSLENTLLKKVSQQATPAERQAMIQDHRQVHPKASVRQMCQTLGVSCSWLYEKPRALEPSEEDTRLRDAIERICLGFPGYGYRRMTA